MQSHAESAVIDRRLLLRHALQEYQNKGGPVAFPVGSSGFDDWLMDSLDVSLVLNAINQRAKVDLILMCSATGTFRNSILSHLPSQDTSEASGATTNTATTAHAAANTNHDLTAPPSRKSLPHLQLPSMAINVDERSLQLLAFQLFLHSCGASKASPALTQSVRAQLEIGDAQGKDLLAVVKLAQQQGVRSFARIDSLVQLLQLVPPSTFQSFRSFIAWRSGIAEIVLKSLEYSAKHYWGGNTTDSNARSLLSALRGSLRRADVREVDDFDDAEYAAATRGIAEAAGRLAKNLKSTGGNDNSTSSGNNNFEVPLGLAVQIAELLLGGMFDSLDEGQFIPEWQELINLLASEVWPQLGMNSADMTAALTMWVHFRQYIACKELSLLQAGVRMVENSGHLVGQQQQQQQSISPANRAFTLLVLEALSGETASVLSDYHASFDTIDEMKALISFLETVELARGGEGGGAVGEVLGHCIQASVGAAFARRAAEVHDTVALEEDRTALLATETAALLHTERTRYVPVLRQYQPAAMAIVSATLHELYGAKMLGWLIQVNNLTKSVAATIHSSVDLEAELLAEVAANGGGTVPPPHPWGAIQRLTPLMHTWAQAQVKNMHGWLERIVAEEDWTPVGQARGATSRSVVEIIKAMEDSVETLFGLGITVPASVVRTLTDAIDGVLQKYSATVMADLGSADSLMPLPPPQTRYKKDLADAAEAEALGGSSGIKAVKKKVGAVLSTSWLPALTKDEQQRVLGVLYDVLVVRANSMYYLATKIADLENLILSKWRAAQEEEGGSGSGTIQKKEGVDSSSFIVPGMLDGAMGAAAEGVDSVLRFITLKLICGDLRTAIFKDLYAFHVEYFRIQPVLQDVDAALGMLCEMLVEALAPRMAGHVCKTLAAAVLHVLLDGGPHRLFTLQDIPLLHEDFDHLKAMFYAEGAGLDPGAVATLCAPLDEALGVMALDTQMLVAAAKNTKKQPLKSSSNDGTIGPELVIPVLCHRADYNASKFLKQEYKVPKKLPNVFSATVSRSFAAALPTSGSAQGSGGGGGGRGRGAKHHK